MPFQLGFILAGNPVMNLPPLPPFSFSSMISPSQLSSILYYPFLHLRISIPISHPPPSSLSLLRISSLFYPFLLLRISISISHRLPSSLPFSHLSLLQFTLFFISLSLYIYCIILSPPLFPSPPYLSSNSLFSSSSDLVFLSLPPSPLILLISRPFLPLSFHLFFFLIETIKKKKEIHLGTININKYKHGNQKFQKKICHNLWKDKQKGNRHIQLKSTQLCC